jgi:hypothetical protein
MLLASVEHDGDALEIGLAGSPDRERINPHDTNLAGATNTVEKPASTRFLSVTSWHMTLVCSP